VCLDFILPTFSFFIAYLIFLKISKFSNSTGTALLSKTFEIDIQEIF